MTFGSGTQSIQECMRMKTFRKTYCLTVRDSTMAQTKDNIMNRFKVNKLHFNPNKTQLLKLSTHLIIEHESINVFGFHIESKLNWKFHIDDEITNYTYRPTCLFFVFKKLKPIFKSRLSKAYVFWNFPIPSFLWPIIVRPSLRHTFASKENHLNLSRSRNYENCRLLCVSFKCSL